MSSAFFNFIPPFLVGTFLFFLLIKRCYYLLGKYRQSRKLLSDLDKFNKLMKTPNRTEKFRTRNLAKTLHKPRSDPLPLKTRQYINKTENGSLKKNKSFRQQKMLKITSIQPSLSHQCNFRTKKSYHSMIPISFLPTQQRELVYSPCI